MAVRVNKPEENIAEKLRKLDKPSGVAGEAILRAGTTREQQNILGVGRRNLIINGDFRISQRGNYTSNTAVSNDTIYVDRWLYRGSGVTANTRHEIGNNTNWGYPYKGSDSLVLTASSSGTGIMRHLQRVEGWYSGMPITFSAWVRSNSPKARLFMYQHGGNPAYRVSSQPHSGNGGWEYLSFTAVNDSDAANQNYFDIAIAEADFSTTYIATGDYIEISEVQAEIGTVATPFERRHITEELQLCKRFYQKSFAYGVTPANHPSSATGFITVQGLVFSQASHNNSDRDSFQFEVEMRAAPGITTYGNNSGYWFSNVSGWHQHNRVLTNINTKGFIFRQQASGGVIDVAGHFAADAEF